MNSLRLFCFAFATVLAASAWAAPNAVVEGVQMPAWLERDGGRVPLAVGTELKDNDQVRTGANARILVRSADGSLVKLGENGTLRFEGFAQKVDDLPGFSAIMNVLEGAFRFTTLATKAVRRRAVTVRVVNITIGIRGTDVWGKATSDRDIVCLIEGRISVARGADTPFTMQDPRSFYIAPRNAPPQPVAPVDPEQLRIWSAETEIVAGSGAARKGGPWKVALGTPETQQEALELYDRARDAGYDARIRPETRDGRTFYAVRIAGLPNRGEAEALAARLKTALAIPQPAVSR
ncbi:MAG: SPOR domain-containing protein [Betaproteobacteria bacterium]|nr:SPOR domain-containing protein [Betaproteobacteria bacterium]